MTATVVIATRNRRDRLLATLDRLSAPGEAAAIVVVDSGSEDGTPAAVAAAHPGVRVIECSPALGSAARTLGVEAAATPLVAFNDDDSWWDPGALPLAAEVFARYPRLGLLAPRILVEPGGRLDPTCGAMRDSPLRGAMPLPGPPVLGFVACGAVARREAFLAAGGFHARFGFGGEEQLLAMDMASAGWGLAYVDSVVARHEPEPGERVGRVTSQARNGLWSAWLRRPLPRALRLTAETAACGRLRALGAATAGLPWVVRERRVVPEDIEGGLRSLEDAPPPGAA